MASDAGRTGDANAVRNSVSDATVEFRYVTPPLALAASCTHDRADDDSDDLDVIRLGVDPNWQVFRIGALRLQLDDALAHAPVPL